MTYLEALESNFEQIVSSIVNTNENTINKYNLENISGKTLDIFGSLHGVERLQETTSSILYKIITIVFRDEQTNFLIPKDTRFYINDEIYFVNFNDIIYNDNSTKSISLDCVLSANVSKNLIIPATNIVSVDSSNTSISPLNQNISVSRQINFNNTQESDEDYKTRIVQFCSGRNINSYEKLKYILSTIGITNYVFLKEGTYSGVIEIVIAPPEMEQFESYKAQIVKLANSILNEKDTRVIIKPAFIRNIKISSYSSVPETAIEFINSLPMGSSISLIELKNYFGEATVAFLDEAEITKTIYLNKYEKFRLVY